MKKIFYTILLFIIIGCKKESSQDVSTKQFITTITPRMSENAILYEANIRQYSSQGNFNALTTNIPNLKKLNVKIVWLMPIYSIGLKNRKATNDKSIEAITTPNASQKYLGSPYSVQNYRSINKDYGTKEDFQNLVNQAHKNGMYVILDWVANHTAWDHPWVTQHNDYYTHDKKGNMISPFNWTDVAELDYNNPSLCKAMIQEMEYWVTTFNIDGFRCDVAAEVPTSFWNQATTALQKIKPLFMLAESEKTDLTKAFNMQYAWEAHHLFNDIVAGKKTVKDFDIYMQKIDTIYPKNHVLMNFTSNHDENSWNGTEYERLGNATETFAALTYTLPGMPLIYNGQEYDLKKRLRFFEKDTIPHTIGNMSVVYEKLGKIKTNNPALNTGKSPASYTRIQTNANTKILAFERQKNNNKIIFIANLSKNSQQFNLAIQGEYTNAMTGQKIVLTKHQSLEFKPWQYWILNN